MPGISVNKIPIPFRKSGINWSSHWTQQLSRNTDNVQIAGYIFTGSDANFNTGSPGNSYLIKNNESRIRQNGYVNQVAIALGANTNVTSIKLIVFRKDGATYDSVATSEELISKIQIGFDTITLDTPLLVNEGDYIGVGTLSSGATPGTFPAKQITTADSLRYTTVSPIPTGNDYDWDAKPGSTYKMQIKAFGAAPLAVMIGDSIAAGHPTHYSFIENSLTSALADSPSYQLYTLNNKYIVQNMGIGPQTSTQINARFAADVVALKPKMVIINGGVNDIAGGSITKETFLANYTAMLNACIANDILPVVCKILPWTNGTNEQMQTRDDWMADLEALVNSATYNGAVWVDFDTAMGKNRVGGDAGNLWDLQTTPDYDNDGVHPTALGYAKMAEVIDAAIVAKGYQLV